MKKSFSLFLSFLLTVSLFSNILAQPNVATKADVPVEKTSVSKTSEKEVKMEDIEQDVAEALSLIEESHIDGKNLDYNSLFKKSIDTMLHTLDPHSNYFDQKEFEEFRTSQESQYFGIGATIGDLRDKNDNVIGTFIKATFENAPANRAGLRYGDKILDVNGTSMVGKNFNIVREHLRGPRGTVAKVTVERYGTKKKETVEIVRDAVSQPSISEAYMIKPGVGYMAISGGFNRTTYDEFVEVMNHLKIEGMEKLVIDLRNNGGGLVREAFFIANTFLETGQTIFTQKGRGKNSARTYRAENPNPDDTPLIVLINNNSASASEILSGALQDNDRALIVGENTFGKGLVQNPFIMEYGTMLLLTIAKYETPSGRLIQRDYSDGNLYDYYTNGGTLDESERPKAPKGEEKRTASGRIVYGGGGISPDVEIKQQTITTAQGNAQRKLIDPVVSFVMDVTFGKVAGLNNYTVDRAITFNYDLKATDFPINDSIMNAFKKYSATNYGVTAKQINDEKEFVTRMLRTEFATAAYGSQTSLQVFNDYDPQLQKAIELFPQAQQLAIQGAKAFAAQKENKNNRNNQK